MSDIETRRKLVDQAQFMARANSPEAKMRSLAAMLNTLGELVGAWTGEQVRIQVTAVGQTESVDVVNRPPPTASP